MRIALINPNTSASTSGLMMEIAAGCAPAGMEGAPLITDPAALAVAAAEVADMATSLGGFDGAIVAAFGDPGRDGLAVRVRCPVAGIAEAAFAEADQVSGGRFAVVTITPGLVEAMRASANRYGHGEGLVSISTTSGDPQALTADPAALEQAMADLVAMEISRNAVRAVIIGGGPLARVARRLAPQFPVPIIEPIPSAVAHLARLLGGV